MSTHNRLPKRDTDPVVPSTVSDDTIPTRDQILHLLRANDQYLWQTNIVDALDVSKASISRNLSKLEANERIKRMEFRGEKLVCLPDTDVSLMN